MLEKQFLNFVLKRNLKKNMFVQNKTGLKCKILKAFSYNNTIAPIFMYL